MSRETEPLPLDVPFSIPVTGPETAGLSANELRLILEDGIKGLGGRSRFDLARALDELVHRAALIEGSDPASPEPATDPSGLYSRSLYPAPATEPRSLSEPRHEVAPFDNRCAVCGELWPCRSVPGVETWRHAHRCETERGGSEVDCTCGLTAFRSVAGSTIPPLDVLAPIVEEAVQDTWPSGDSDVLYARSRHIAERIIARLAGSTEPVTEEPR